MSDTSVPIDDGLRSLQGIRWLSVVGALVVAVSVVRLVAARWGDLPLAAQFLVLAGGALGLFAAGDVIRHRLHLPTAGSALLFLFVAIVPVWAWGAAALDLLAAPFGWLVMLVSLAAMVAALLRTLRSTLDYRDSFYPAALAAMLVAMPVLSWLESTTDISAGTFFFGAALALGLLLRTACRHVNRFFFHRDRRRGQDRPVHLLPFAMAVWAYTAAMSLLNAFESHFAVVLVFLGVALAETGEEYYRALVDATGEKLETWPRRSVALLALGFAGMVVALPLSFYDNSGIALAVTSTSVCLYLFAWALRYRGAFSYTMALCTGAVAYHSIPALIPQAIKDVFYTLMTTLGIGHGSPAIVSLADLGLLTLLVALAAVLRPRLTRTMDRIHGVFIALDASLLLLLALAEPPALKTLATIATLILAVAMVWQRRHEVLPVLYQGLAFTALGWTWKASYGYWHPDAALALGILNLLFLATGIFLLRQGWFSRARSEASVSRLLVFPVLFSIALTVPLMSSTTAAAGGTLALLAAIGCRLASSLILRLPLQHAALIMTAATLYFWGLDAALVLVLAAGAEVVFAETLLRGGQHKAAQPCWSLAIILGIAGGWTAITTTLNGAESPWLAILPGFLASLLFVLMTGFGSDKPRVRLTTDSDDDRWFLALLAMGSFGASLMALISSVNTFADELLLLGPGLALLGFSGLMRRQLGEQWSLNLFTLGAGFLYAMPVLGLLDQLSWTWQIVLLLFAVAFGAASFRLRSRSLLIVSTGALVTDLAFFLIHLRATDPTLLWAAGILFGLGLMTLAAWLEHRRELLLQHVRIWGREIRSWA